MMSTTAGILPSIELVHGEVLTVRVFFFFNFYKLDSDLHHKAYLDFRVGAKTYKSVHMCITFFPANTFHVLSLLSLWHISTLLRASRILLNTQLLSSTIYTSVLPAVSSNHSAIHIFPLLPIPIALGSIKTLTISIL